MPKSALSDGARLVQPWTCPWPPRAALHTGTRAPARRGACTRAGQPRTPACGRLKRPCTRALVPPARGACTHGPLNERRRTTTKRCCVPTIRAQSRRRRSAGYGDTGRPPRQWGARLVPPMRAWLTPPHGRRHRAPLQPCALTTQNFWGQITHSRETAIWPMLACHFQGRVDLQKKKVPLEVLLKLTRPSYMRVWPNPIPPEAGQKKNDVRGALAPRSIGALGPRCIPPPGTSHSPGDPGKLNMSPPTPFPRQAPAKKTKTQGHGQSWGPRSLAHGHMNE